MNRLVRRGIRVLRTQRRVLALALYTGVGVGAYAAAFLIRFDFTWPRAYAGVFIATVPIAVAVRGICAWGLELSSGRWRFVSTPDVLRLAGASMLGSAALPLAVALVPITPRVPYSVLVLDAIVYPLLVAAIWIAYRSAFQALRRRGCEVSRRAKPVVIVGAGEAAERLIREMLLSPMGYTPVACVDDDAAKQFTRLHDVPVLGTLADLPDIARGTAAHELIIAIPSATPDALRRIVEQCERSGLPFRTLPGIGEVLSGTVRLSQLRQVRIEDLLGREPIQLSLPQLGEDLGGRTVLITGAAGSIGSELSRQVALHEPGLLVLLDQAETDLFYLELDLRKRFPDVPLVPVVGDIVERRAVERIFRQYRPQRVFHAAAYKHVPMMEHNPREAIRNNVIGTWRVAEAAGRHGAGSFILVSTDKAVRPSSIMGATKRLAEMAVLELQTMYPETSFGAVRFGNVLGSNGSVVPVFKRQLAEGLPLTVTHPDVTRYFMTVPEAVQLILQASLLPELRGHIAMLEMGEPVRIVDLALNLLRLAGIRGALEERLVFTGLRPGEKLHEELTAPEEETVSTAQPKVRLVKTHPEPARHIGRRLTEWNRDLEHGRDAVVLAALGRIFPQLRASLEGSGAAPAITAVAG